MNTSEQLVSALIGKDRIKAADAAAYIINNKDEQSWALLMEKADFLFDYIKNRAGQHIFNAVKQDNYNNLFVFLKYHSPDFDKYVADAFAQFKNDDLKEEFLQLLAVGTESEMAYAAKYFSVVPTVEVESLLFECSKSENISLKFNAAEALGHINSSEAYNYYLNRLSSDDDWDKLDAAQFLSAYGKKEAVPSILQAMHSSAMAENIAGEVASLVNLADYIGTDNKDIELLVLEALDNILVSIPEIWPVSSILSFRVYECLDKIVNILDKNSESLVAGKYIQVLFRAKNKVILLFENDEYTFDQDKLVLGELEEIYHLIAIQSDDFWNNNQKLLGIELISNNEMRQNSAISVIADNKIMSMSDNLVVMLNEYDILPQLVIYHLILALKKLDKLDKIDNLNQIISDIKDFNLVAELKNHVK